jgi:hypothetical protein
MLDVGLAFNFGLYCVLDFWQPTDNDISRVVTVFA